MQILKNPMSAVIALDTIEHKRSFLRQSFELIHSIYSPLASQTKSMTGTVSLLLRNENFGIKSPVIIRAVSFENAPAFLKEKKDFFISPLIFGSDHKWFSGFKGEFFTLCFNETIVVYNTMYEEPGIYIVDLDDFLSEIKDKTGLVSFALHTQLD